MWWSSLDVGGRVRFLLEGRLVRIFEATNEELAAVGYVNVDVAMHGMLGKQIDAELFPSFGEAPLAIERDNISVNTAAVVVVH